MKSSFCIRLTILGGMAILTGCSRQTAPTGGQTSAPPPSESATAAETQGEVQGPLEPVEHEAARRKIAANDPLTERRLDVLHAVDKLTENQCDILALELELIPRDEVLNPLSTPRYEVSRYVRRVASKEELDTVELVMGRNQMHPKPKYSPLAPTAKISLAK